MFDDLELNKAARVLLTYTGFKQAVDQSFDPKADNFLVSTFFSKQTIFDAKEVEIDARLYRGNVAAQFSGEFEQANLIKPDSYDVFTLTPVTIKESYFFNVDDILAYAGFGRTRYDSRSAAQKLSGFIAQTLRRLEQRFYTRFEAMAADCLFTGAVNVEHNGIKQKYSFWPAQDKPSTKVAVSWDKPNAKIMQDIDGVAQLIRTRANLNPTVMVVGPDVKAAMFSNDAFMKLFDIRNVNMGNLEPKFRGNGVTWIGRISALGIDVYSYEKTYQENSKSKPQCFIPKGKVLIASVYDNMDTSGLCYGCSTVNAGGSGDDAKFVRARGALATEIKSVSETNMHGYALNMYSRPAFYMVQPQAFQVVEAVFAG